MSIGKIIAYIRKNYKELIGLLAAIATILGFVISVTKSSDLSKDIREIIAEQKEDTVYLIPDNVDPSIIAENPGISEIISIQNMILQYFRISDALQYPENFKSLSSDDQLLICKQDYQILYELKGIDHNLNQSIQLLIDNNPKFEKYIDTASFSILMDKSALLNKQLDKIVKEIQDYDKEQTIKTLWKLFNSKVMYEALKSRKDTYVSIFKATNILINDMK